MELELIDCVGGADLRGAEEVEEMNVSFWLILSLNWLLNIQRQGFSDQTTENRSLIFKINIRTVHVN